MFFFGIFRRRRDNNQPPVVPDNKPLHTAPSPANPKKPTPSRSKNKDMFHLKSAKIMQSLFAPHEEIPNRIPKKSKRKDQFHIRSAAIMQSLFADAQAGEKQNSEKVEDLFFDTSLKSNNFNNSNSNINNNSSNEYSQKRVSRRSRNRELFHLKSAQIIQSLFAQQAEQIPDQTVISSKDANTPSPTVRVSRRSKAKEMFHSKRAEAIPTTSVQKEHRQRRVHNTQLGKWVSAKIHGDEAIVATNSSVESLALSPADSPIFESLEPVTTPASSLSSMSTSSSIDTSNSILSSTRTNSAAAETTTVAIDESFEFENDHWDETSFVGCYAADDSCSDLEDFEPMETAPALCAGSASATNRYSVQDLAREVLADAHLEMEDDPQSTENYNEQSLNNSVERDEIESPGQYSCEAVPSGAIVEASPDCDFRNDLVANGDNGSGEPCKDNGERRESESYELQPAGQSCETFSDHPLFEAVSEHEPEGIPDVSRQGLIKDRSLDPGSELVTQPNSKVSRRRRFRDKMNIWGRKQGKKSLSSEHQQKEKEQLSLTQDNGAPNSATIFYSDVSIPIAEDSPETVSTPDSLSNLQNPSPETPPTTPIIENDPSTTEEDENNGKTDLQRADMLRNQGNEEHMAPLSCASPGKSQRDLLFEALEKIEQEAALVDDPNSDEFKTYARDIIAALAIKPQQLGSKGILKESTSENHKPSPQNSVTKKTVRFNDSNLVDVKIIDCSLKGILKWRTSSNSKRGRRRRAQNGVTFADIVKVQPIERTPKGVIQRTKRRMTYWKRNSDRETDDHKMLKSEDLYYCEINDGFEYRC